MKKNQQLPEKKPPTPKAKTSTPKKKIGTSKPITTSGFSEKEIVRYDKGLRDKLKMGGVT